MAYDDQNIFAKILRGEIPAAKVYEDDYAFAFNDINPLAPTHILVIPKGSYVSSADFTETASDAEIAGFMRAVGKIAKQAGIEDGGYRLITNHSTNARQEVPHFHMHIVGGADLGRMMDPIKG